MATPAEVANDMASRAGYWRGRDGDLARACTDAAFLIRCFLNGAPPQSRSLVGLLQRLARLERSWSHPHAHDATGAGRALTRARVTLEDLRREAGP